MRLLIQPMGACVYTCTIAAKFDNKVARDVHGMCILVMVSSYSVEFY